MCSDASKRDPQEVDALMFLRPLIATVLGVVRLRARARWQACWRPHPRMVCLGAVLFAVVSLHCFGGVGDPGRLTHRSSLGLAFWGGRYYQPAGQCS